MPLPYHPVPGTVLVCDYSAGFLVPEMVKKRLCITISPRLRRREGLVAVVPLSQTQPHQLEAWHVPLTVDVPHWGGERRWAACDMLATVGFHRLNQPHTRNPVTGARRHRQIELCDQLVNDLRRAVCAGLGL
jgi:mRNA interferase MazF